MQDINLLQNKLKDKTNQWEKSNRAATGILVAILVVELAAGAFFFLMTSQADKDKAVLDQDNVSMQSELTRMDSDLGDAKAFQAQSKNIATLLDAHVSWSGLFDELITSIYKSSQVFTLNSDTTGEIHLEGMADGYSEVGKMLLALETADKFSSVRLMSTSLSAGERPGIMFSVEIFAGQEIFVSEN